MPLIMDNIVVYLFQMFRVLFGNLRSRSWPTVTGVVVGAHADTGSYPSTDISYTYEIDGTTYNGRYTHGFWYDESARRFAREFPDGKQVTVRYSPKSPVRSFLPVYDRSA